MHKKVYIHIGHFKTGSTAIQHMLTQRSAVGLLEKEGYYYPQTGRCSYPHPAHLQILLAEQVLAEAGLPVPSWVEAYARQSKTQELYDKLAQELKKHNDKTAIISCESFIRLSQIGDTALGLLKGALDNRPVEIIVYLRRQDEFLESWFNEVVKNGHPVRLQEFTELKLPSLFFDYHGALAPWARVFGKENITVIRYDRALAEAGIESNFEEIVNLPNTKAKQKKMNPSLPVQMLLYKAEINRTHSNVDHSLIAHRMAKRARKLKLPMESLFEPEERRAILRRCAYSNAMLSKDYGPNTVEKNVDFFRPLDLTEHPAPAVRSMTEQLHLFGEWTPAAYSGFPAKIMRLLRKFGIF